MSQRERLNIILDYAREFYGVKSDRQLARRLEVDPSTVWRWRQGESPSKLAELLVDLYPEPLILSAQPTEAAA